MIELDHVVKRYGGHGAVDGMTLTIEPRTLCAFVGPSGCGKSTTLRLINALIRPDEGAIRIDGEDIARIKPETLRRGIGYVIQSIGLFPHWNVADNIATVPRLLRWPAAKIEARIDELLDLLRLDPAQFRGKFPHQLSGGQQQRIGVARALAADPNIVLMDEPFGALDPPTREALQGEIRRIQAETKKTIVFVTHDMDEALRLGDRVAVMQSGKLVQYAAPAEILAKPANDFVRQFVGGADMSIRVLAVARVAERLTPDGAAEGDAISADASLKEALTLMMTSGRQILPVTDAAGRRAGIIRLADLARL
jgi:osmoprotectant transport system ATP-binding protein